MQSIKRKHLDMPKRWQDWWSKVCWKFGKGKIGRISKATYTPLDASKVSA